MFQEVDLTNPKTFRNLAKPMGAQTDERLAQYKKRYKDWEDPNGEALLLPLTLYFSFESKHWLVL